MLGSLKLNGKSDCELLSKQHSELHTPTVLALSSASDYDIPVFLGSLRSILYCMKILSANAQFKSFMLKKDHFFFRLSKATTSSET